MSKKAVIFTSFVWAMTTLVWVRLLWGEERPSASLPEDAPSWAPVAPLVAEEVQLEREAAGEPRPRTATVLGVLMGIPREWSDRSEPDEERRERFAPVRDAIEAASPDMGSTAALLALLHHESMGARRIQYDQCRPDECPGGALGLWQVQRNACPQAEQIFSLPPTAERLRLEAECALYVYWFAQRKCAGQNRTQYIDGMSGYRGLCKTTDGEMRGRTFEAFARVLVDGWPVAPSGWVRDPSPSRDDRKLANMRLSELNAEPGDFIKLPSGAGMLVEWHWHEWGGDASPRGWHHGLSLFAYGDRDELD